MVNKNSKNIGWNRVKKVRGREKIVDLKREIKINSTQWSENKRVKKTCSKWNDWQKKSIPFLRWDKKGTDSA